MAETKICEGCGKEITGRTLKADGGQFHPECFKCDKCGEPLKGPFTKKDGQRICQDCVPKATCFACKQAIVGPTTTANKSTYHPECLKCEGCSVNIASGFFVVNEKLMCNDCAKKANEGGKGKGKGNKCIRCEKAISGSVVYGDKDDMFHPDCFTCEDCGEALNEFVADESRKFTYQKATYICPPCFEKSRKKADEAKSKPCFICTEPCLQDSSSLHLLDGYSLHWACFKCKKCGKAESSNGDSTVMRLLRSKVALVRADKYFCETCFEGTDTHLGEAPDLKVGLRMMLGTYLGKEASGVFDETAYCIKLMDGGRCWLDYMNSSKTSSQSWHAEGTYEEELHEDGELKALKFTNELESSGDGPAKGKVYEFAVERGATNKRLICEGLPCPLQVAVPDFEISEMMTPQKRQAAPKPVPTADADSAEAGGRLCQLAAPQETDQGDGTKVGQGSAAVMERTKIDTTRNIVKVEAVEAAPAAPVPTHVPQGCFSLEDLRDSNVWKDKGVDANTREQYLSDEAFVAVFGCTKADFEKLPKWKRDQQKKAHKLF